LALICARNGLRTEPSSYPIFGLYPLSDLLWLSTPSKLEITNPDINRMEARAFLAKALALEELDDEIFDTEVLYSMIERGEMQRKFSEKSDAAKMV
jgi:hypothetical protein